MPARVVARTARRAFVRPMFAALETLEVRAHVLGAPARIAGQIRKLIPVGIVRVDQDHRVVRGAAPERAGPRIENATDRLPLGIRGAVLEVLLLPVLILVVPDEEVPADAVVLRRERMKRRHVVVVRQTVDAWRLRRGPDGLARIATGFDQQHAEARLGEPCRHGAASRA